MLSERKIRNIDYCISYQSEYRISYYNPASFTFVFVGACKFKIDYITGITDDGYNVRLYKSVKTQEYFEKTKFYFSKKIYLHTEKEVINFIKEETKKKINGKQTKKVKSRKQTA